MLYLWSFDLVAHLDRITKMIITAQRAPKATKVDQEAVPPAEMLGLPLSAVHPLSPTNTTVTNEDTSRTEPLIKRKRGRPSKAELTLRMKQPKVIFEEDDQEEEEEVYEVEAIKGMRITKV